MFVASAFYLYIIKTKKNCANTISAKKYRFIKTEAIIYSTLQDIDGRGELHCVVWVYLSTWKCIQHSTPHQIRLDSLRPETLPTSVPIVTKFPILRILFFNSLAIHTEISDCLAAAGYQGINGRTNPWITVLTNGMFYRVCREQLKAPLVFDELTDSIWFGFVFDLSPLNVTLWMESTQLRTFTK